MTINSATKAQPSYNRPFEPGMAHTLPLTGTWKPPTIWIKADKKKTFNDKELTMLIDLGFRAGLNCGFDCSDILIRSGFHNTTRVHGKLMQDRWHVSYGLKHPQIFSDEFIATHAYTPGQWQLFLTDSTQDTPKPDSTVNYQGNAVWPKNAVRLPKHLYPTDMEGIRRKFIRRALKKFKIDFTVWDHNDPDDLFRQRN